MYIAYPHILDFPVTGILFHSDETRSANKETHSGAETSQTFLDPLLPHPRHPRGGIDRVKEKAIVGCAGIGKANHNAFDKQCVRPG